MKIRITKMFRHIVGNFPAGMELELPMEHAKGFIKCGYAERVKPLKPEPAPPVEKPKKAKREQPAREE